MHNGLFDNFFAVAGFNLEIQPAHRLYLHERSHFTESVTAALFYPYRIVIDVLFKLHAHRQLIFIAEVYESLIYVKASARYTARSRAHENAYFLRGKCSLAVRTERRKFLS